MLIFETERLLMRPWTLDDLEDFFAYQSNPNVGPAAGWKPASALEESMKTLSRFAEQPGEVCAITLKETGKAIGSLGLHRDEIRGRAFPGTTRMLGYVLAQEYWGKGYMTEAAMAALRFAFDVMGLELISVQHFSFNDRSRRVIEKCGFHYEGQLRRTFLRYDGAVLDECMYSMTRDEFYVRHGL